MVFRKKVPENILVCIEVKQGFPPLLYILTFQIFDFDCIEILHQWLVVIYAEYKRDIQHNGLYKYILHIDIFADDSFQEMFSLFKRIFR